MYNSGLSMEGLQGKPCGDQPDSMLQEKAPIGISQIANRKRITFKPEATSSWFRVACMNVTISHMTSLTIPSQI